MQHVLASHLPAQLPWGDPSGIYKQAVASFQLKGVLVS